MRLSIILSRHGDKLAHSLFFVIPFLIYGHTAASTVFTLDSAELTTAAATLGIIRSTGYPTYTLLGYLWSHIPIGDIGYRLNLFSAFWGALTLFALELSLTRIGIRFLPRLAAVAFLGTNVYFWSLSTVAEIYTLNSAFIALIILGMVLLREQVSLVRAGIFGLLVGLSLTNHGTALLFIPGYIFFWAMLLKTKAASAQHLVIAACGVVLGLTPYLYLPLRYLDNPVFNYAGNFDAGGAFHPIALNTIEGFISHITGKKFQSLFFAIPIKEMVASLLELIIALNRGFFVLGFGAGILGVFHKTNRDRILPPSLLIAFLITMIFLLSYRVVDRVTMFLPLFLIWALWIAFGLENIFDIVDKWQTQGLLGWRKIYQISTSFLVLSFCLIAFFWNLPLVERENTSKYRDEAEEIFKTVENDAVIIGYWDRIPILQYLQLVENQRKDVSLINRFLITDHDAKEYIQSVIGVRPIYSTDSTLLGGNEIGCLEGMELCQILHSDQEQIPPGRDP
jgi:hypothetical protein